MQSTSERWLPVIGFEGRYEVSDQGRVRRLTHATSDRTLRSRVMKQWAHPCGYPMVSIAGKGQMVHRLMAEAFLGPQPDGHEVCHYDDNPTNNRIENLRWGTRSDNKMDTVRLGTHPNARKTRCPNGHLYSGENLLIEARPNGRHVRRCRICTVERKRRGNKR